MKKMIMLLCIIFATALVVSSGCGDDGGSNATPTPTVDNGNIIDVTPTASATSTYEEPRCRGTVLKCEELNTQKCPFQKNCRVDHDLCVPKPSGLMECEDILTPLGCGASVDEPQYGCYWA